MSARALSNACAGLTWLALRPEPLPTLRYARLSPPSSLALKLVEPFRGIACVAFGVGKPGAAWLDRLAASNWFTGLAPQKDDLAAVDAKSTTPTSWPAAPLAAVAITADAGPAEHATAFALVAALRARRDARGCRMAVAVTLDGADPSKAAFEAALRRQGAFVIRPGSGAGGDHLHHLPLRVATYPRRGRLVCVDLADYLATWPPGGRADLHVIPQPFQYARQLIDDLRSTCTVDALNLELHYDPDSADNPLAYVDQLASYCREHLLQRDEHNLVFTTAERLDGSIGTLDVLSITGSHPATRNKKV